MKTLKIVGGVLLILLAIFPLVGQFIYSSATPSPSTNLPQLEPQFVGVFFFQILLGICLIASSFVKTSPVLVLDPLRYAGCGPRFAALMFDCLILIPLIPLWRWGNGHFRLFALYYLIPSMVLGLAFNVYLVKRFGGTPGKLIMRLNIRKLDGTPAGYREAFLRYLPECLFGLIVCIALIYPLFQMTDTEYFSIPSHDRINRLTALAPSWYKPFSIVNNLWIWGEFAVLLTNRKRRALHDFIAGTVVIHVQKESTNTVASTSPVPSLS